LILKDLLLIIKDLNDLILKNLNIKTYLYSLNPYCMIFYDDYSQYKLEGAMILPNKTKCGDNPEFHNGSLVLS
jgi:hypothetical protein